MAQLCTGNMAAAYVSNATALAANGCNNTAINIPGNYCEWEYGLSANATLNTLYRLVSCFEYIVLNLRIFTSSL